MREDGELAGEIATEISLDSKVFPSLGALLDGLSPEAAAIVCTQDVLIDQDLSRLNRWVQAQPDWSDLPFIVLAEDMSLERRRRLQDGLGNVIFLEPSDKAALRSALYSARRSHLRRSRVRAALQSQASQLAQSEKNLRTVFETSHQYQSLLGGDGRIVYANATALGGIGVGLEEVFGQLFCESPWFSATPGMTATVRAAVDQVAAGQTVAMKMALNLPSGKRLYDFSMRPLFDDRGGVVAIVPEAVDITARTHAEDGLRQAQKMEAVGQLTGGVAHDFNNLLTVIKSCSELLKRRDLAEAPRERYIAAISETADRAARLTAQLLAFARRQALQPKVFDMSASVIGVSDMMRTLCGSRIDLALDLPDGPCFVDADPSQFDTALVNMVVNARDAMSGAGRLVIRVARVEGVPPIRAHAAIHAPYVSVSIRDTGTGMTADMLDKIFEPFFTTKSVGEGTGLGLSQVFGFAKQSQGEVLVHSAPGDGSTFTLFLRRAEAPPVIEEDLPPEALVLAHGARVLVVEDNREVGEFVTQSLEELGYRSRWVRSAKEALAVLAEDPRCHDIVFTDVVMAGMDGLALGQAIRRLYPEIPVVLTSGYSEVLARDPDHGFELLQKPYSVQQLSSMLSRAVAKHRLWLQRPSANPSL